MSLQQLIEHPFLARNLVSACTGEEWEVRGMHTIDILMRFCGDKVGYAVCMCVHMRVRVGVICLGASFCLAL